MMCSVTPCSLGATLIAGLLATGCAASSSGDGGADGAGNGGASGAGSGGASGTSGAGGSGGMPDFDNAGAGGSGGGVPLVDGGALQLSDGGTEICGVGSAGSFATDESLDLFGEVIYFHGGNPLPAGRYRVEYVDGCMKYASYQDWAVHAYQDGTDAFWLVGDTTAQRFNMPPGTYGFMAGSGGHATFEECVAANQALEPIELDFAGGKLGLWLQDSPYSDNLAGVDGRNPTWSLTLLGNCALLE